MNSIHTIVISHADAYLHNEQIFVIIAEDGITVAYAIQIIMLEGGRYPRHVDIVQVNNIQTVRRIVLRFTPFVSPSGRKHAPVKLRSVLQIVTGREFRRSILPTSKRFGEEGSHETRKLQPRFNVVFLVVLVLIAFQSRDGLKSAAKLNGEQFTTSEKIPVLIRQRCSCSQIAGRIRPFGPERNGVGHIGTQLHITIEQGRIRMFLEVYIGIFYGL